MLLHKKSSAMSIVCMALKWSVNREVVLMSKLLVACVLVASVPGPELVASGRGLDVDVDGDGVGDFALQVESRGSMTVCVVSGATGESLVRLPIDHLKGSPHWTTALKHWLLPTKSGGENHHVAVTIPWLKSPGKDLSDACVQVLLWPIGHDGHSRKLEFATAGSDIPSVVCDWDEGHEKTLMVVATDTELGVCRLDLSDPSASGTRDEAVRRIPIGGTDLCLMRYRTEASDVTYAVLARPLLGEISIVDTESLIEARRIRLKDAVSGELIRLDRVDDTNNDGVADLVITYTQARHDDSGQRVLVVHSGAAHELLYQYDEDRYCAGILPKFGNQVMGMPDINGDGSGDVVVCAYKEGTWAEGAILAISGSTGEVIWESRGRSTSAYLGYRLWKIGDVDADGVRDLIAIERRDGNEWVYVLLSGRTGRNLRSLSPLGPESE